MHNQSMAAESAGQKVESVRHPRRTLGRLFGYLKPHRLALTAVAALIVAGTLLGLAGPVLMGRAIDQYMNPHGAQFGDLKGLGTIVLMMVGVYAGVWLTNTAQGRILATVAQKAMARLRQELFAHIQELSLSFYDRQPIGELMSRLTNDMDAINQLLAQNLTQLISSVVSVVSILIVMFVLSWQLALATMLVIPLMFAVVGLLGRRTRPRFRASQNALGKLNGLMEETLSGQRVVIAFGQEDAAIARFETANQAAADAGIGAQFLAMLIPPLVMALNYLDLAVVVGVGSALAINGVGGITVGLIAAFTNYARRFTQPLLQMADLVNTVVAAVASAERIFEVIDEEPAIQDKAGAPALTDVKGHVVFDHVDFGYVPGVPVLKDVTLEAQPGQMFALVGPTGAGKTTIINVLTRFYDIQDGAIYVDDRDIRDVQQDSLRGHLGIVLQDTFLFADTVLGNIRYGRLDATDEEVIAAARMANADQFIRRLPQGYQTVLAERGSDLSQGQRQLLAIARAILSDPDVLILDEATSSVDTRTEKQIQEALMRLMAGRTSFVIAHRLSTIRDADRVLVIKDGEIIERGTHDELMDARGFYHNLHTSQYKGLAA
jgi:ATP-binding cassette subfamily B protein